MKTHDKVLGVNKEGIRSEEYHNLVEASNNEYNAFCDYIEKYEADDVLMVFLEGKLLWAKRMLEKFEGGNSTNESLSQSK